MVHPEMLSLECACPSWQPSLKMQTRIVCICILTFFAQLKPDLVKYIALLSLVKIVPSHPHLVAEYQETILASINDQDISIRMRALDLLSAMVCTNFILRVYTLTIIPRSIVRTCSPSSNNFYHIWFRKPPLCCLQLLSHSLKIRQPQPQNLKCLPANIRPID